MVNALSQGDAAPGFSLPADGGRTLALDGLKGRKAVLYFYPKDDTSGCTKEAIDFSALRKEFANADTEIIGISADSVKSHDKFKARHDLAVTLAADEEKQVVEAYGVWVEKSMYGRKFMGIERATFLIGRDGKIARIWRKVSVPGHAEEVLQAAMELA